MSFGGEGFELWGGNVEAVDIVQFNSVVCGVFDGVECGGSVDEFLINPCHDDLAGAAVAVDNIVDGAETHGADAAEECEGASFDDPHFVFIAAGGGVIVGVKSTDDTGEGFCEGAEVVGIAFEGE